MASAGEKFQRSLRLREWAEVERRTGMSMAEFGEGGAPIALLTACMLTIAKKRLGGGFKFEEAEDMNLEEAGAALTEAVTALGFEDDPEDADANFTAGKE